MHLCLLPDSLVTQQKLVTDAGIWTHSLIRRSIWNVRVWSVSGACVAPEPSELDVMRNATIWVGVSVFVYTQKGQRDYSRAWRPQASQRIIGPNRVNQPCLTGFQQRADHHWYKPMIPTFHSSVHFKGDKLIHLRQVNCYCHGDSLLLWAAHTRAELQGVCKVIIHLALIEGTLGRIIFERWRFNWWGDLLFRL